MRPGTKPRELAPPDAGELTGRELAFEDVVMRYFPLATNLSRLRRFCDHYLALGATSHHPTAPR